MIALLCASFIFAIAQVEKITFVGFNGPTKAKMELYCSGWPLTESNYRLSKDPNAEIACEMVKNSKGEVDAACPIFVRFTPLQNQSESLIYLNTVAQLTKGSANCFYGNSSVCTTTVLP